jgi:hypothetical protein
MGTEIEVNEGEPDGSVLAEAAVASAALGGAAVAKGDEAIRTADEANARADAAGDSASAALSVAAAKPSSDEVDAKIAASQAEILAAIAALKDVQVDQTLEVQPVAEAPKDTAPKSVEEPKEKKGWYDRYLSTK